jgi:uncharacterized protein (DUF2147 family)
MMRIPALAGLMMAATMAASFGETAALLEGTWLTADGSSKIRFESCGAAACGRLVWLREANDPQTGKPLLDKNNPDPAQRTRKLLGILVFTDVLPIRPGEWSAKAYNAEDSNQYDVTLSMRQPDQLALRGCGLGGLICQTELWTRAQ